MAKKIPHPEPVKAARLEEIDGRLVFMGIDTLQGKAELTALHLPGITECDLVPGKYYWDETRAAFLPLPRQNKKELEMTNASNALALTIHNLHKAGFPVQKEVRDWFNDHRKTIDFGDIAVKYKIGDIL